jgi:dual specificity MAP kinase phosphatase
MSNVQQPVLMSNLSSPSIVTSTLRNCLSATTPNLGTNRSRSNSRVAGNSAASTSNELHFTTSTSSLNKDLNNNNQATPPPPPPPILPLIDDPSSSANSDEGSSVAYHHSYSSSNLFIDAMELKNKFLHHFSNITFLDCRTATDFQQKHIQNSVHVNCRDKLTRKRLLTRRTTVKDLISCKDARSSLMGDDENSCPNTATTTTATTTEQPTPCMLNDIDHQQQQPISKQSFFANRYNATTAAENSKRNMIVLYDDKTSDVSELQCESNPLKIVQDNIKQSGVKKECKILKGGFKQFIEMFPEFCVVKADNHHQGEAAKSRCAFNQQDLHQSAIDNAVMTKITNHLYLGNEIDSQNVEMLEKEGIHYILNVTKNIPMLNNPKFKYKRINANDCQNQNLRQHFDEAFEFIDEAKANNGKVLVHCQAGVSRSPTIVIAYLMNKQRLRMNDAYEKVRESRPIIAPNIVFMSQLLDYEAKLFSSTDVEETQIKINNPTSSNSNNFNSNSNLFKTFLHSTSATFNNFANSIEDGNSSSNGNNSSNALTNTPRKSSVLAS